MGAALLDQTVIAGAGNVLRAESLFRAGVHPSRPAPDMDREAFHRIWVALVDLMAQSVEDGRIISAPMPPFERATRARPTGAWSTSRPPAGPAGAPVETWDLAGRTAYACSQCQLR